ncbi:DNA (cytosine-5)-methyltransferase 1 [Mucilaginibacter frigoritolerans]|uniref:Cytosine-specific methyltransferase n=1 Tax=Mucilaginibacter frigoritolerans TaxID=652788 RepID=A0A562U9R8_9SPHI|nr:DNA cytosine methyltransferase [Mucilaginibacter frigoritolerans]TWJ02576.1 DNA (cytosine-5)-methyltransferase 1 [Mucilaginibacter frigoritolerans]
MSKYKSIEICAGAGGQALGLEQAGFEHAVLVEIEPLACQTLKYNRPTWNVISKDIKEFTATEYTNIDLLAGGVPCPPFSYGGKQLGQMDERDLFPEALRLVKECQPKAVMLENVRGLLDNKFEVYRKEIIAKLKSMGYEAEWKLLNSSDYGVSQLRPRAVLVALKKEYYQYFTWPEKLTKKPISVGELLFEEMASLGWENANAWARNAKTIAPTLVGGSKKHGGADLGPTRAKQAWAILGVDGKGLADMPPVNGLQTMPRLTLQMTALIQGFPINWKFIGKKTPAYRQVGNAFPPPVARAVGTSIKKAFELYEQKSTKGAGVEVKAA